MTANPGNIVSQPAGPGRRLLAITYDALIVAGLLFVAAALALPLDFMDQQAFRDPLFTLYLGAVWFLYEAWCWRRAGMTLGMRAWRIRLVDERREHIGWARCLVRFVVAIAGFVALGAGFFWSFKDPHRRCWHDLAAGTRLVRWREASD